MDDHKQFRQKISLHNTTQDIPVGKKQARIELRAMKDALPLNILPETQSKESVKIEADLKRVTAYCTAERINLKDLYKNINQNEIFNKATMYFGECLYASIRLPISPNEEQSFDIFYYDYGVVVCWGLQQNNETVVLNHLKKFEENKYEVGKVEVESFRYGIVRENPMVLNDIIYLNTEDFFNKMVISNAIAQSVKLDYFENLVDMTVDTVKDLPEEVENEGKVGKTRKDILKLVGKL
ncbi:putative sporulation protein Rmd1, partial [Hamiltosporidium tvaerminnensis]